MTKDTTDKKDDQAPEKPVESKAENSAEVDEVKDKTTDATSKKSAKKDHRRRSENTRIVVGTLIGAAVVLGAAAFIFGAYNIYDELTTTSLFSSTDGNSANFTEGSIAEVANSVSPAVVSVKTETRTYSYFGQDSTSSAAGTGTIVTSDGYVVTNKHVVEDANSISVVLDDGTEYDDVELVGEDPLNDVAYLKIKNVSDLPTVTLGDSKTIVTGQQVIAIGNALGQYQNSVTEGIISGTGRTITATDSSYSTYETLNDMIQTDASINAGNSGGPLVNAAGEVIGINTAVSNGNGIGFAIPISSVKGMLKNIIENGKAERAYLGVSYVNLTPDVAKSYDLSVTTGAYVTGDNAVISGSPAEKAGIKTGDIIVSVGGVKVGSSGTVSSLLGEYTVGDKVEIIVLRDGKEVKLKATLEAYPNSLNSSNNGSGSNSNNSNGGSSSSSNGSNNSNGAKK